MYLVTLRPASPDVRDLHAGGQRRRSRRGLGWPNDSHLRPGGVGEVPTRAGALGLLR